MILKSLGPSFRLLNFFGHTTTESYGSNGLSFFFQLLNRASFIKKKDIKDYKDHFSMHGNNTPPPPKKKEPCHLDLRLFWFIQQIV